MIVMVSASPAMSYPPTLPMTFAQASALTLSCLLFCSRLGVHVPAWGRNRVSCHSFSVTIDDVRNKSEYSILHAYIIFSTFSSNMLLQDFIVTHLFYFARW
jgi:hypothetical protein